MTEWQPVTRVVDSYYVVCPHCGHKIGDCWEWVDGDMKTDVCDDCGKSYAFYAEYSVSYITVATEKDAFK